MTRDVSPERCDDPVRVPCGPASLPGVTRPSEEAELVRGARPLPAHSSMRAQACGPGVGPPSESPATNTSGSHGGSPGGVDAGSPRGLPRKRVPHGLVEGALVLGEPAVRRQQMQQQQEGVRADVSAERKIQ